MYWVELTAVKLRELKKKKNRFPFILKCTLVGYFLSTFAIVFFKWNDEHFFTGHWFVETPRYMDDFGMFVTEIGGKVINPPDYAEFIPELKNSPWFFQAYGLIQDIGRDLSNQNKTAAALKIKRLTSDILKSPDLKFEIHKRHMNTLDYLTLKKVEKIEKLGI